MITNGTVVSDALKYVNGKAEKLKNSVSTVATSETEETTANCSSGDS